jgi:hypothetical protein
MLLRVHWLLGLLIGRIGRWSRLGWLGNEQALCLGLAWLYRREGILRSASFGSCLLRMCWCNPWDWLVRYVRLVGVVFLRMLVLVLAMLRLM